TPEGRTPEQGAPEQGTPELGAPGRGGPARSSVGYAACAPDVVEHMALERRAAWACAARRAGQRRAARWAAEHSRGHRSVRAAPVVLPQVNLLPAPVLGRDLMTRG